MNSRRNFRIHVIIKLKKEVSPHVIMHLLSFGFEEKDQHTWEGLLDPNSYVWLLRYAQYKESLVVSIGNGFFR